MQEILTLGLMLWRKMVFGNNRNSTYTKCIITLIGEQEKTKSEETLTLVKETIKLFGEMGLCPVELLEQETKKETSLFTDSESVSDDIDAFENDGSYDNKDRSNNSINSDDNEDDDDDNNDDDDDDDDEYDVNNGELFTQEGFMKDRVDSTLLFYEKYFLREFMRSTERQCLKEMEDMIGEVPMIKFIATVKQRIDHERETCRSVLFPSSFDKVYPAILKVLVETHAGNYCSELRSILEEFEGEAAVKDGSDISTRVRDLRLVYDVLSKTKFGLLMAQSTFSAFVEKAGRQKVEALFAGKASAASVADLPAKFSKLVIGMWNCYSGIVSEQFMNDPEVRKSLRDAFRNFVNASYKDAPFNAGEALARFLDNVLKKGSKGAAAAAAAAAGADELSPESIVRALAELFPLVDDKDVFFALYSRSLSKRLITGTSVSKDLEQRVISDVITSDNKEYFLKFNGMFEDLEGSAKLTAEFRASGEWKRAKAQCALPTPVVQLLSSSFWSLPQLSIELRLPEKIARAEAAFEEYFAAKNASKKLVWAHNFAKADISTTFFGSAATPAHDGGYVITAPISQIAVLNLFNDADSLTYAQISEKTQLFGQHLDSSIYPFLILHMLTAVVSSPAGAAGAAGANGNFFPADTVFSLNRAFVGKKAKIALGLINPATSAGAAKFLCESTAATAAAPAQGQQDGGSGNEEEAMVGVDKFVAKQRLEMTKACIVRVMKAEKEVTHSNLFGKVSAELQRRFKLTPSVFKKALDYLLDEEYVARSKKEKDLYQYI